MSSYAVVAFFGNDESQQELATVPINWLAKTDKKCFWPSRTGKYNLEEFVKRGTKHKKNWPSYDVLKVYFKTDNYDEADSFLERLIRDNAIAISESDGNTSITSLLRKDQPEDEDNDDSEMIEKDVEHLSENNNNHTNVQILPILQSADVANLVSESVEPNLFDSSSSTITLHQPLSQSFDTGFDRNLESPTSGFSVRSKDFETIVLETISKIEAHVENHSAILNRLLKSQDLNVTPLPQKPLDLPLFPIKDVADFKEFDKKLNISETLKSYMKAKLSTLGGTSAQNATRSILRFLLTNEVAQCYNWKGHGKYPFESTAILKVINEIVQSNYDGNETQISTTIKEWLKNASTRTKYVKKH
ncbi:uncharacterized protein [Tenebrio molitor]|uniref:uncharacterized protein isoform X1 n=1 Tax=Tenebrio molitor TaxID=7067 RepID=UPI00362494E2